MQVALYARVSSDKQDVDLSLAAQLKALREYAAKNGYAVVREFVDEAESGRTVNRPTFQEMIGLARRKPAMFEAILVWKLSRFARNREDSILYKSLLRKHGVQVVSVSEPIDNSPTGQMLEGIIEVLDEFYSKNLAQDVVRGMREAAGRGYWVCSATPYGYRRVSVSDGGKMRAKLEVDESKAQVVRRVFAEASKSLGMKEIAKGLNKDGIASPGGVRWSKSTVHKLLTNEVYSGTLVWGRSGKYHRAAGLEPVRIEHAAEPLVAADVFRDLQAALRWRSPRLAHPRRVSSPYLLSGLLKCGRCMASMLGLAAKSGQYRYYVCATAYRLGRESCAEKPVRCDRMDSGTLDGITNLVLEDAYIAQLVRILNEEEADASGTAKDRVAAIDGELNGVQRRLERLYEAIEAGGLSLADLSPRIKELRKRQDALLAAKAEAASLTGATRRRLLDSRRVIGHCREIRRLLAAGTVQEQRTVMQWFVEEVVKQESQATIRFRVPVPQRSGGGLTPGVLDTVIPGGQIAILYIDRWDELVISKALNDAGIKYAGERDQRYPRTPFTRWLEEVASWCSSFPDTQQGPAFNDLFSEFTQMRDQSGITTDLSNLDPKTAFFQALIGLAAPGLSLADWLNQLDENLGLGNLLAARQAHPDDVRDWNLIRQRCEDRHALAGFTLEDFARCGGRPDTITLTTLHSSKGLEYQVVIIPGLEQGRLPGYAATTPGAMAEARRVFYVGMTRAKDSIYLLYSGWYRDRYDRVWKKGPSQFVEELQAKMSH